MITARLLAKNFWLSDEPVVLSLNPRQALVHFFAVPLFLAFLSGWPQVGRTIAWSKSHALGFWMGLSFSGWWLNDLVTRSLSRPLRGLGMNLLAVLLISGFAASFPADIVMRLWVYGYVAAFPTLPLDRPLPGWHFELSRYLTTHVYGVLTWSLINLGMFHVWKMPCFGFVPTKEGAPERQMPGSDAAPSFLAKLPISIQGRIIALASEQHYLRVYTDSGEALILYRLSDAVRELGDKGLQVHRSFWVAWGAVRKVQGTPSAPRLELVNELDVPVSRSFRLSVEKAGYLKTMASSSKRGSTSVRAA